MRPMARYLLLAVCFLAVIVADGATSRSVSWWTGMSGNKTIDAAKIAALVAHPSAVTRVMLSFHDMQGDTWKWYKYEQQVREWHEPLKEVGIKVLPTVIDTTNATWMHEKIYRNQTAFIAEAVAVAEHFGFQGWHIDYEDENPRDNYPHDHEDLKKFLTEFADALHAKQMELVFDVASWSYLLMDYTSIASSSVDELMNMDFYNRPASYKSDLKKYYAEVRAADPKNWGRRAGVGIGIYYDGHNGHGKAWTEENARSFVAEVVAQGGQSLDIFRLCQGENSEWWPGPDSEWWWTILAEFAAGGSQDVVLV
eukprot:gnl/TRDRNA2_/TRDRNA2_190465_c0_seq1.p1 gnl/TRDRNA2_/TRDRNA2_190465_c0~~gnl/TRDRNA2_/TRDRNA2_190465_c0_seq1.p1  ORF type:complete len:310 (+),score=70.46 gnl/TRDRNA2_/TRDRNA2_190465_c0_seq1:133-1062(+)